MPLSWTCGPSARGRACRAGRGEFVVAKNVSATKPAEKCLNDLRVFGDQMEKDGHWLGGAGYGYGYPMGEIGYGYSYPVGGASAAAATGYMDARPAYEVRTLLASANILARQGNRRCVRTCSPRPARSISFTPLT